MNPSDNEPLDPPFGTAETPYRQVFEGLGEPVLVVAPAERTVVDGNRAAAELMDCDRDRLRGRDLHSFVEDLRTPAGEWIDPASDLSADSGPETIRGRVRDVNGETVWAEIDRSTVTVDGTAYTLWTIDDRGDAVRREQDLRTFKTAVEHAGHAIYWTDVDGRIEYANPAFEEITGYDREAVVGENPRILRSGEMDRSYYQDLWETILSGETFQREVINENATGDRIVLDQTVAPIPGPDGEIQRFVAVNNDITDRKEREETLQAEKRRIDRLHQRLTVMNRILRHDIRSSVNIIRGNAELATAADRRLDQALETIVEEADRLQRIGESVRHLQEVLEEGESATNVLDLVTLTQTKVLTCRNEFPEAEFSLTGPNEALVRAREGIDLALDHLLSNAVVHNDADRPVVEVSIETDPADEVVILEIADDGPGIPEAELRPIREGRETPLEHTSGLGLWLAHWIVDASGGDLSFEERDPRGTVAVIELPTP